MIERKFNEDISFDKIRLHSSERNQSWNDLFELFKANIKDSDIRYYPNLDKLYTKCKKFFNCNNIIIGSGSDRCIKYFFEANQKFNNVITTNPSFPMYKVYSEIFGFNYIGVNYKTFNFPEEEFLDTITEDSIVILSNPNTPIAHKLNIDFIKKILEKNVPTLIDEAYIEFAKAESVSRYIKKYSNLYVTRTFSKALGSAGIRAGVLLSNKKNIENALQFRDMHEITGLSAKWIKILINNYHYVENYIDSVLDTKKNIEKVLEKRNISYINSYSNWLHIKEPFDIPEGIVVKKGCKLPGSNNTWTRMSICSSVNFDWIKNNNNGKTK